MICRYCHKVIIDYEKITIENKSGYKRIFHTKCFFKAIEGLGIGEERNL